jgi:hypothetical protein
MPDLVKAAAFASAVALMPGQILGNCCETISDRAAGVSLQQFGAIADESSQEIKQQTYSSDDIPVQDECRRSRHSRGHLTSSWSGHDAGCDMPKSVTRSSNSTVSRLFVLELNAGCIHSMNTDGSDRATIVAGCHLPDGIVVDADAGHIYWTNMGVPNLNDGSIERADINGENRKTIVAKGQTHTPKQIILEKKNGKLYWCDREGMRVMRCNLDGSQLETLIEAGRSEADRRDQTRWCVGLAIDPKFGRIYWTQKGPDNAGLGRIFHANVEIPAGQTAAARSDIEIFFDGLPEPIDLELDHKNRVLYWTDRGDPPRGNTVNRASIDDKPAEPEIIVTHLMEGIGIALDVPNDRMFVTDFAGSVYSARLDGSGERNFLYAQGNLTGIAYAEV